MTSAPNFQSKDLQEGKLRPSLFHGIWDGCEIQIEFDPVTIDDIILHDARNVTYTSIKAQFTNGLANRAYLLGKSICAKKDVNAILVASCDC